MQHLSKNVLYGWIWDWTAEHPEFDAIWPQVRLPDLPEPIWGAVFEAIEPSIHDVGIRRALLYGMEQETHEIR